MIGRLFGYREIESRAPYAHLACDSVNDTATRLAESIADDILSVRAVFAIFCEAANASAESPTRQTDPMMRLLPAHSHVE